MRRSEDLSPFRKEGLLRRTAPFLVAMIVGFAAVRLPAATRDESQLLTAAILNVVLVAVVALLPWERLPRTAELVPPLLYMVVIAILRDALGGSLSAYSPLLVLPVLWLAMYGTRVQLAVGVLGVAVLLVMPILLLGDPQYPEEEWRRALLWVTVSAIVGLAVQDLVDQVRQRADALHTVSAAVGRRTREIETRSAICEAAKDNARATFALLLEPDANGRRLVTTAATSDELEGVELYLTDTASPGVRSYEQAREVFQAELEDPPLVSAKGAPIRAASMLWHPVPGRDGAMGVLALGWSERLKRLPETLSPVMEALAAEAAGVIERTTLLLRLEGVAKVDEVTKLPNERAWEEEVPRELGRARRQGTPLSVVILDLGAIELGEDGAPGPDDARALRAAADTWRAELSTTHFLAHRDVPGRFSVLLPDAGPEDAAVVAARLQALAPPDRECTVAVATWDGSELPAALVGRAENQIELDRAASRRD